MPEKVVVAEDKDNRRYHRLTGSSVTMEIMYTRVMNDTMFRLYVIIHTV